MSDPIVFPQLEVGDVIRLDNNYEYEVMEIYAPNVAKSLKVLDGTEKIYTNSLGFYNRYDLVLKCKTPQLIETDPRYEDMFE